MKCTPERAAGPFHNVLIGTAVGDSLGLPAENLSARRIARRWKGSWKQSFFLGNGMVSDDTEHTVFVAQSLLESRGATDEIDTFQRRLVWKLRWWFFCIPAGIGLATLRAIAKLWLGWPRSKSGVFSAGNGPAMRSAIIGVFFAGKNDQIKDYVRASTRLTHTDPKAETAALTVALTAGWCVQMTKQGRNLLPAHVQELIELWSSIATEDPEWSCLVGKIANGYEKGISVEAFAHELGLNKGISGYCYHTVPVALFSWLRHFGDFRTGLEAVLNRGGDTDTVGAITGALLALNSPIPQDWMQRLVDFPISKNYLQRLAEALAGTAQTPRFHWIVLPIRNLIFFALVLIHVVLRLVF